ncbi:MAG TPA: gamma-glutamyltransferase, partial [Egibacteraceae bacterium]|nr:gamma-glutamyltransferase [Egibacteraceae bacterium]
TGLAGGGHAVWWDAAARRAQLVDFFVAVPGLRLPGPGAVRVAVDISFGTAVVPYEVGIASCAVPGVPAGCEALWRRWGRLPWPRLVEPALRLARSGVSMPATHAHCLAMLAPVMTMNEGAHIYAPGGRLLAAGERLHQPGLVRALELLAGEGAASFYRGAVAEVLLALMREHGGLVTRADLEAYRVRWPSPAQVVYAGTRVSARRGLSGVLDALRRLPALAGLGEGDRARALLRALAPDGPVAASCGAVADTTGHTTNVTAVDAGGNACVATTTLGLGSGDFLPGLDVHLNSMLGEADLRSGPLEPGARMDSLMTPTVAADDDGLVLAGGSAGGTRIRSALVQVLAGVLGEAVEPAVAVERPRLHPVGSLVHVEPGFTEQALQAVAHAGYQLRRWDRLHHYFGGVSLIARAGAAADPRRDGAAALRGCLT